MLEQTSQLQRVHEDDHLALHDVETQQGIQQQRLLLFLHLDVVLAQVYGSTFGVTTTGIFLLQVDGHTVVKQFLLEKGNVVVQRGGEDNVLAGGRNELDHFVDVIFVTVGKELGMNIMRRTNHIGLIDDERMHGR